METKLPIFTRETTLVKFCLLSCNTNPFWKGVYAGKEEFASSGNKFCPYRADPFSEGEKNKFDKVTSPENVYLSHNTSCFSFH